MMAMAMGGGFILCPRTTASVCSHHKKNYSLSLSYNHTLLSTLRVHHHHHVSAAIHIQTTPLKQIDDDDEEIDVSSSGSKLIAQNVPWSSTAHDIRQLFHKYGTVLTVELSMHNKTRNRGLAFVTMSSPQEALAALHNLQSYEFEGRSLNINYAKPQNKKKSPPDEPKMPSVYNLFVANMSYETRSKDLRNFFEDGGLTVYTAEIIFEEDVRKSSGYGFVSFNSKEDADAALSAFQGKMFMGRSIRLARSKRFERHEAKTSVPEAVSPQMDNVEYVNRGK